MKLKNNSISSIKTFNFTEKEIKTSKIKLLLKNGLETSKSFFPSVSRIYNKKLNSVPPKKLSCSKDNEIHISRKNNLKVQSHNLKYSHNNIALHREFNKSTFHETHKSFSSKDRYTLKKNNSRLLDTSIQTQCNFNNKLLQNYLYSKSNLFTNGDNCLKVEKVIGKDSKNECKEVNQCETLKVTKSNIVFNHCKKKEKDDQINKFILNYLKKKVNSATLNASTFRMQKLNVNLLNNLNDYIMNNDDLEENDLFNYNQVSSVNEIRNYENKILAKDIKQTVPIFTKI